MPTNLHWHTLEYAPRPDDAAGPQTFPPPTEDTLHKLKPPHIAATAAFVLDLAGAMPAARQANRPPNSSAGEKSGLGVIS